MKTRLNIKFWPGAFGTLLLTAAMFTSCGEKKEQQESVKTDSVKAVAKMDPLVKPPFTEVNIKLQDVIIDADSGKTFMAGNKYGTTVEIPGKIFVDSAGNTIKGKINIRFREMHTMNDIFTTGIPLSYDAAGMLKRFNSGGMFEIRASQNNEEVFLDSGKVINVRMASFENSGNYHAFYLDEASVRNWIYLKDLSGVENPEKQKIMQSARRNVDESRIPFDGSYFAFNYMALLDVYLNDRTVEIKKNRNDLTLQGKIKEYGVTWSNIYCYQSVELNGTKTLASLLLWKKQNKEPWPVWAASGKCDLQPADNGMFALELVSPNGKAKYKTLIQPFFPIKSLLAFSPSYWKNKYNLALRKAIEEEMRKQKIADVFQAIEVHRFGIYNIDKLQEEEDYVQVAVVPTFDKEVGSINDIDLYYMSEQYRTVVKYSREQWSNITVLPDSDGKLFAVLPGNKIAIAEGEALKKLNYREMRGKKKTVIKLKFETVNTVLNTVGDIAKALATQEFPI